jgi:KaiC/GvpD/RAD55 family RecA-like ATPase
MDEPTRREETARVSEVLPDESLGSNILIVGPTLSEKETIALDLLAESWTSDCRPFVITATDTASQFRSRFDGFTPPNRRTEDVYVIDCLDSGRGEEAPETPTCTLSTPADLTGIGICLSKGYDEFGRPEGRFVLVDNLSTLLVYSDVDRIFRFLSTINNRVTELGDVTVQLMDDDAVDTADRNKLLQLFSSVIEVREEGGQTLFRVRGDTETTWDEYPSRGGAR